MAFGVKKISGFTLLLVCSVSSACLAATPEQDIAMQKLGLEYNRRYDLEHGYTVADNITEETLFPVLKEAEEKQSGSVEGAEDDVSDVDIDLAVFEEVKVNQSELHTRELELDNSVQEEGRTYNRRFDLANGYTENEASVIGKKRTGNSEIVGNNNPAVRNMSGSISVSDAQPRQARRVTFPKPENNKAERRFVVAGEHDRLIQEAAQNYNRQYDARYGYVR